MSETQSVPTQPDHGNPKTQRAIFSTAAIIGILFAVSEPYFSKRFEEETRKGMTAHAVHQKISQSFAESTTRQAMTISQGITSGNKAAAAFEVVAAGTIDPDEIKADVDKKYEDSRNTMTFLRMLMLVASAGLATIAFGHHRRIGNTPEP